MKDRPKLLLFVSVDWFFCSHFLDRAVAAAREGFDVVVVTHVAEHREKIEAAGLKVIHLALDRKSVNPLLALVALFRLCKILRHERPSIVHNVALKPIILGSLATRLTGRVPIVNAVVGGGFIFSSNGLVARLLRFPIGLALKLLLNPSKSRVVFENKDDLKSFVSLGYVRSREAVLIRGAGVDMARYTQNEVAADIPLIVLPARLLWDKGIGEFVDAARLLKRDGVTARFVVVGGLDPGNRASIDEETLRRWREEALVEFWGFRSDMPAVLAKAAVVCLPSYREGLPKALLEGMAAGLPCVTTDVPGCREAVSDGVNGILVSPRDMPSLASALHRLIVDQATRQVMGTRGRAMAAQQFSTEIVQIETVKLYRSLVTR
ncbi:glycosyltransferase family 4 protein [Allorhizobium sp. NPDC080224]|uniref:glycosyltransferase family 4 protein n=1 Tax=Allorhizobium sp. NPDC080224 TaxID=3390547 RepID=UPI003D002C42